MRRALTLHIGVTKTGSTSIQYALLRERKNLAAQGIWYPFSAGPGSAGMSPHHFFAASATKSNRLHGFHQFMWDGMSPPARLRLFRQEFATEMRNLPQSIHRCIITSELLSRLEDQEVEALGVLLEPFFERVKVIVYIRRQDQHLASNFNQNLRNGMQARPKLPKNRPLDRVNEASLDYDALTRRYSRVFGADSVAPRIFDRRELKNRDFVSDFLDVAEIDLPTPEESASQQRNPSINSQGQALLMAVIRRAKRPGGEFADNPAVWRRLGEIVTHDFPGQGWKPGRAEAEQLLSLFEESNDRVKRRYFPARPTLFDQDLSALPDQSELPLMEKALDAALSTLVQLAAETARRDAVASMEKYRLLRRLDDQKDMRAALTTAIRLAPDTFVPRLRMAELCLRQNRLTEAAEHAKAAIRIKKDSPVARRIAARIRARLRDADGAPGQPNPATGIGPLLNTRTNVCEEI